MEILPRPKVKSAGRQEGFKGPQGILQRHHSNRAARWAARMLSGDRKT